MPKTLERPDTTTPTSRCDGCGGLAAHSVITMNLGIFVFCERCYQRHRKALEPLIASEASDDR